MNIIKDVLESAEKSGLTKLMIRLEGNHEWVTARLRGNKWETFIVPARLYCPAVPSRLMIARESEIPDFYVKYPKVRYGCRDLDQLSNRFAREAKVCEHLNKHPHPNLAKYQGCIVKDGLIKGICYSRYQHTLTNEVNPMGISKRKFQYNHTTPLQDRAKFLEGVEEAIAYLHSLGLVHNDLKPDNIVLTADETPIVIDFDSCLPLNEALDGVPMTAGWHDPTVSIALFSNDLKAIGDIREWLSDNEVKQYHFQCLPDSCSD